jgi:hypothetical protein
MPVDRQLLEMFEEKLDPSRVNDSPVPARVLGYGEISCVFELRDLPGMACKRMPLFKSLDAAQAYTRQYREYCGLLTQAGLTLPDSETAIISLPHRPVVLYIIQRVLPPERFAHVLIHHLDAAECRELLERISAEIAKVWDFNRTRGPALKPGLELALDGQLSNWVAGEDGRLYYVDTSTPMYRVDGRDQLDAELLLQSAPWWLRWILRWLFVEDVKNRYFVPRQVYTDLAANLLKEQKPDLVPAALAAANFRMPRDQPGLTLKDVAGYYREDKWIWTLFLAFRRIDRWISRQVLRRRYEFILPGKIKR